MASRRSQHNTFYQYLASLTAVISIFINGMHYGWCYISFRTLLAKSSPIHVGKTGSKWLRRAPTFSLLGGSLSMAIIIDIIGKHKIILLSAVPHLISWIMIYLATNYVTLLIARLIAGFAIGWSLCAVPLYIGEISEPRIRGLLLSLIPLSWILGSFVINIIGTYCNIKITAAISCVFPIISIMVFASMPESPYFLIMRGKKKAAKKVLQILSGKKDVEKDILRIEEGFEENNSTQKNPLDLFRKSNNRKGIIIILCLKAFQEFSGDTAINEYSQYIFKEAKVDISEEIATFIFFVVELVVTGISALLIDTSGRRRLLIVSSLGSALSILTEGIYFYLKFNTNIDLSNFNIIPLIALVTFVICFCAGLRGIHFVLLGELFTQTVKAPAVCVAYLSDEILIIIVSKFLQLFENRLEMHIPFITFGVFTCIGMVFIILYVPETKGKTLEEIQYSLKAKNN